MWLGIWKFQLHDFNSMIAVLVFHKILMPLCVEEIKFKNNKECSLTIPIVARYLETKQNASTCSGNEAASNYVLHEFIMCHLNVTINL